MDAHGNIHHRSLVVRVITFIELGDGREAVVSYAYDHVLEPVIERVWLRSASPLANAASMVKAILAGVPWKQGHEIDDDELREELMVFGRLALEEKLKEEAVIMADDVEYWN